MVIYNITQWFKKNIIIIKSYIRDSYVIIIYLIFLQNVQDNEIRYIHKVKNVYVIY